LHTSLCRRAARIDILREGGDRRLTLEGKGKGKGIARSAR
jgi:hypothetical protein